MAKHEAKKRSLKYRDFDEMLADVETLQRNGYSSQGNWSLGQACGHIAEWMRFPLDGFPEPPLHMRVIFWLIKKTVAPGMKRKILAEGFKPGMPTAPATVPENSISDEQGIGMLKKTAERVKGWDKELIPSPLFGPMDKELHVKVSLLHAEHHLGYLEPK